MQRQLLVLAAFGTVQAGCIDWSSLYRAGDGALDRGDADVVPAAPGLSAGYPGDVGIEKDPAVVFVENFEEGSLGALVARYSVAKNQAGMALVADVPSRSSGKAALKMTAGAATASTYLFGQLLPGHDELYFRYYVKYQGGVAWQDTGPVLGGYNPPMPWPDPQHGVKPNGDDRFLVVVEPHGPRLDFSNYWMKMHSWMTEPSGTNAYIANTLVHQKGFAAESDSWMCIEVQVKLNPDPSSGSGAELAVWKNDQLVQRFTDSAPLGYWALEKFCPQDADGTECTDHPPPLGTQMIPLDLQFRSTTALQLNSFWLQSYLDGTTTGSVWYDDMVVATARVGCLR